MKGRHRLEQAREGERADFLTFDEVVKGAGDARGHEDLSALGLAAEPSAKVLRRAIGLEVKGRTRKRRMLMTPMALPSRRRGAASDVLIPVARCRALSSGYCVRMAAFMSCT